MAKRWDRRRRPDDELDDPDSGNVDLDDDAHAWWAQRDELEQKVAFPERRGEPRNGGGAEDLDAIFDELLPGVDLDDPGEDMADDLPPGLFRADDPYVVLGVPSSSTWDEIVAQHRKLAWLHHPDRLLDATPEARERSEGRMRDVNLAYRELRQRRDR